MEFSRWRVPGAWAVPRWGLSAAAAEAPPASLPRRAVGSGLGWTEGLRPAGSGAGQAWARVRREAVREARLGRPGSRGHPPFRKTQPEVAGSATFHLNRPQHPPSGPRAVPALSAARARLSAAAALPKCSRRLLPATCTFLLKRQKNLPDLRIVFTLHTFIALFTFRSSL